MLHRYGRGVLREGRDAMKLRAPFPWFGGKSRVAPLVWSRFGDVANYCEPFAGSLAVLLGRPTAPRIETVNDLDAGLANFWRALAHDPDAVAHFADWPVNETDLHARHRWLVAQLPALKEQLMADPDYFDAKIAGWWVWGQCLWIGSGWCQGHGTSTIRRIRHQSGRRGVIPGSTVTGGYESAAQFDRNPLGTAHQNRRPHLTGDQGTNRRWQGGGQGGGSGVHAPSLKLGGLYDYMNQLADRLRRVRVCCGDWRRVLTPSVTTYMGVTGVLLDPPYSHELRERCYSEDHDISADVRKWAIEHGDDPNFRIALCGYAEEHGMPDSWECVAWKAHGGYSRTERGKANRSRERVWFSPHCARPTDRLDFDCPEEAAVPA